jgi:hypothetical protein
MPDEDTDVTVKDMAELEAKRAEAEGNGDDEEEGAEEGGEVQPQARSERDVEEVNKKLAQTEVRYRKRVLELLGADAEGIRECPLCWRPGFIPPEGMPWPDAERRAAIEDVLGIHAEADYPDSPDAQRCEQCDGYGRTKTGSRAEGQITKPCGKCNGTGWTAKFAQPASFGEAVATVEPFAAANGPGGLPTIKDAWGRPQGHPHFGIEPAAVGA